MRLYTQSFEQPAQVVFAIDDVIPSTLNHLRCGVAYISLAGCNCLDSRVEARIGSNRWSVCLKETVTCFDYGFTEPEALEHLLARGDDVRIADVSVLDRPQLRPRRAFHPKLLLFDGADSTGFVLGSANLTAAALSRNTEVVAAGIATVDREDWTQAWSVISAGSSILTADLLARYKSVRPRVPAPDPPLDPPVQPGVSDIVSFWAAITAGTVIPSRYECFWVQAGAMSSGGSRNQLELPRGCNIFFGFSFQQYDDHHVVIGFPELSSRGSSRHDRRLTWHGNNRMERINLPTVAQGGFWYPQTVVLFRRRRNSFELHVVAWDDPLSLAWREASSAKGTLFRVGEQGSTRLCGLI